MCIRDRPRGSNVSRTSSGDVPLTRFATITVVSADDPLMFTSREYGALRLFAERRALRDTLVPSRISTSMAFKTPLLSSSLVRSFFLSLSLSLCLAPFFPPSPTPIGSRAESVGKRRV